MNAAPTIEGPEVSVYGLAVRRGGDYAVPQGENMIEERRSDLGTDKAGIRGAFFDHELTVSTRLGSVINIPAIYDGTAVGTINLLAPEHHCRKERVAPVARLAPTFLAARIEAGAA